MDIPFDGQYDSKTFFKALRLVQRTGKWDKALRMAALGAATVLLVTFAASWLTGSRSELYRLLIAILLALFSASPFLSAWWTTVRLFHKRPGRAIGGRANAQGITLLSKMVSGKQRHIPWKDLIRAGYADGLISLLATDGGLWVFRRDFFAGERDWNRFEQLVRKNISTSK